MSKGIGHALTLRRLLKGLLASSAVAVSGLSAIASCGGKEDETASEMCRVSPRDASTTCETFELAVAGNAANCAFDASYGSCETLCGPGASSCSIDTARSVLICRIQCAVEGRMPPGLRPRAPNDAATIGEHIAVMAHHEAAAVHAFEQLARELHAHGAPRSLVRELERAAGDERRHAALCGAFAAANGAEVELPDVAPTDARSLLAVAEDNAREGCGRELLGAAVGLHVSEHASSAEVRDLFASITRDELRHAAVSLRMQRWLRTRLTREERRAVDALMCATLAAGTAASMPASLAPPTDDVLRRIGERIAQSILVWLDHEVSS